MSTDSKRDAPQISSRFLRTILTQKRYEDIISGVGISIHGVRFAEPLELNDIIVQGSVFLTACDFIDSVDLSRTQFSHSVSFVGSTFAKGIRMHNAKVGGELTIGGSDNAEPILTDSTPKVTVRSIDLFGTEVAGDLNILDAIVDEGVSLAETNVAGSLQIFRVLGHEIDLHSAEVHRQLVTVDSKLEPRPSEMARLERLYVLLNLFSIHASQNVFLNRSVILGLTELEDSEIAGSLELSGALLSSVHAHGANI